MTKPMQDGRLSAFGTLRTVVGPAQHPEVLHTLRLYGEQVIPDFRASQPRASVAGTSA